MRRIAVLAATAAILASLGGAGSAGAAPPSPIVVDRVCVAPYDTVWLQVDWADATKAAWFGVEFQLAGSKKTQVLDGGVAAGPTGTGITAMAFEGVVRQYAAMRGVVLAKNRHVAAAASDWIPIDGTSLAANGWPAATSGSTCP